MAVLPLTRLNIGIEGQSSVEYQMYVHNYSNGTFMEKPMFPVLFNESQILVGQNWTVVVPLEANHTYHAYLYGAWINTGPQPKTDYNVYVYDPYGTLVGYHAQSAGLPPHLGDTVDAPFFTPEYTGNYTFIIANNPVANQGAQQATFMIIEDLQPNTWYQRYLEGENNNVQALDTSWAYEFVTNSQQVEVDIQVPTTLNMYEARLYLMADSTVTNEMILDGVPLAWEPGLYGNTTGTDPTIGGYNLDYGGYRGSAYASCEYPGENMIINYTSPHTGLSLYQLVLIGEYGAGTINFLIKTVFGASLQPSIVPGRVYLDSNATVAYVSNSTDLVNATLEYTIDGWASMTTIPMNISDNRTCTAVIPAQAAGTLVIYRVEAYDYLGDFLVADGNYTVRQPSITFLEKPGIPVWFNDSQIEIGRDWSVVVPLEANHTYHAYLYGAWINTGPQPKTDYDVYVYDPYGTLVGYHTQSAGLPPNLGDTVDTPFFTPEYTGNYTFIIANNPVASQGAQQATFMIIEDLQTNTSYQRYLEGENNNVQALDTSWAYEFVTDSQQVEVDIQVPTTLDMYEARLYLMADSTVTNEIILDGVPLAWEPGLYGNTTGTNGVIGGYNLDYGGYRGSAYASCEYPGENMIINYTSPHTGLSLYQLVLIGEYGAGTINFRVKTMFDACLQPSIVPGKVYLDSNATVAYVSELADLVNATLEYTIDGWASMTTMAMNISDNRTCTATIPQQPADSFVMYKVEAYDSLGDTLVATGNYSVIDTATFLEKPGIPVWFNDSQIEIGRDWSVVVPLEANHTYHAYLYGAWINTGPQPKTDYNVYVYDPYGNSAGNYTASAGILEDLGDMNDTPFFVPSYTGNYTFRIVNNAFGSSEAQQATFMIIEDAECNEWHEQYIEGANGSVPTVNTSWAYEFVTDSQQIEIHIKIPETLTMYEARLYLMADSTVTNEMILDGVPLAWEPGLYGNTTGTDPTIGGYNLNSQGYRGVAYTTSDHAGEDMLINYTSPHAGLTLYHLVLIGDYGAGTVDFLVQTVFNATLQPSIVPSNLYPNSTATIAYVSESTDLLNATLQYSTDNWISMNTITMQISGTRTCTATIPGQSAGTQVVYGIEAMDVLEDILPANGSYAVKQASMLNISLTRETITLGDSITVVGDMTPQSAGMPITVNFGSGNESPTVDCVTLGDGSFKASFQPDAVGTWYVQAAFSEDASTYGSLSSQLQVEVVGPSFLAQYSLYIGLCAAGTAVVAVVAVLYLKKRRGKPVEEEW
jgi:hypothetical protein